MKNKKGFTLAEILLVIAIIAILSGATLVGVSSLVNNSKTAGSKVKYNAENFELEAASKLKEVGGKVPSNAVETETLNTKPQPSATQAPETQKPTESSKPAETAKPTSPSKPSETAAPTQPTKPTETTKGGGGSAGGGSVTVSNASLTTAGSNVAGPCGYSVNGDTVTVKLNSGTSNAENVIDIKIKKQADGKYLLDLNDVEGGKYWMVQNCGLNSDNFWGGEKTKVMTAQELQRALHMTFS